MRKTSCLHFDKYIDSTQLLSRGGGLKEIAPVRVLTKTNAVTAIVARLLEKLKPEDKTQELRANIFVRCYMGIWWLLMRRQDK